MSDRLPLVAWLLMTVAAVALIVAQLHTSPVSDAAPAIAQTIVAPVQGTPRMLVVLVATETPTRTATPNLTPTITPWPTETPWNPCPQPSGGCQWYWPTITPPSPTTPTPFPVCSTPVMGQRCIVPTPIGGD